MRWLLTLLIFGLFLVSSIQANTPNITETQILFPAFFSTPETGFGGGAFFLNERSPSPNPQNSPENLFQGTLLLTEKSQIIAVLTDTGHLNKTSEKWEATAVFLKFPTFFYGTGPNTLASAQENFTPINSYLTGAWQWPFTWGAVGPVYQYSNYTIAESEAGGLLSNGSILGSQGAILSGLGIQYDFDSRSPFYFPKTGQFVHAEYLLFRKFLGGSSNFEQFQIDTRTFFEMIPEHILAGQIFGVFSRGNIPFQRMGQLGGDMIMRGYTDGRFVDKVYLAGQVEYRFPIWSFIRGNIFSSIGQVAPTLASLDLSAPKLAWGFGLRFQIVPDKSIHFRFDMAFAEEGSSIYIKIMEAF